MDICWTGYDLTDKVAVPVPLIMPCSLPELVGGVMTPSYAMLLWQPVQYIMRAFSQRMRDPIIKKELPPSRPAASNCPPDSCI